MQSTHTWHKKWEYKKGGEGVLGMWSVFQDTMITLGLGETERFGVEIAREYGQAWSLAWPTQLIKPMGM